MARPRRSIQDVGIVLGKARLEGRARFGSVLGQEAKVGALGSQPRGNGLDPATAAAPNIPSGDSHVPPSIVRER